MTFGDTFTDLFTDGSPVAFPAKCPIADTYEWLPQRNIGGPMPTTRGLVLHVNEGNGDPYGWWTLPTTPIASSHFQLMKSGQLIQYVPLDTVAWCQVAGSTTWHSIETEGFTYEALTDAAVAKLAALYAWGHVNCGWPMQLADSPDGYGFGTHAMGGMAWGGHPCPGDIRTAERAHILELAKQGDDPVATVLDKFPVIDPGRDVGHPHMVILIEALLRAANPIVDLSTPAKKSLAVKQWQAIFYNEWKLTGGPNDKLVNGKVDKMTLALLLQAAGGVL